VAMLPAIHNAILDALSPLGATRIDGPATPFAIWRALREARSLSRSPRA